MQRHFGKSCSVLIRRQWHPSWTGKKKRFRKCAYHRISILKAEAKAPIKREGKTLSTERRKGPVPTTLRVTCLTYVFLTQELTDTVGASVSICRQNRILGSPNENVVSVAHNVRMCAEFMASHFVNVILMYASLYDWNFYYFINVSLWDIGKYERETLKEGVLRN